MDVKVSFTILGGPSQRAFESKSMQTRNPFLDEFAKLTTSAMELAQSAGEEAKSAFRAQADKFVADMDLVRRDEHDALKAEVAQLRAEIAALKGGAPKPAAKPRKPSGGTSTGRVPPQDAGG